MSRVTLDELLEEVGVSPTQLDKACTSEHLQDIALFLESWRTVAPHLGLSNVEVEEVERAGTEEKEKRRKILEVWKAGFAFKAKYKEVIKALLKIGRADQAEKVCRVLVPKEGQLTPPPEATPLPPSPLTPQSSVGADSPQPSPSVEELSSQPLTYWSPSKSPTYQQPSQTPTYQHPSQPPTNLESAQVKPLSIEEEIEEFEVKYAKLVYSVLVSFQQGSVSFRDIQACLMALPISLKHQWGNLLGSKARQLSQASSIGELFFILSASPHWNFYNPYLLSHLVEQFGNGHTKQQKDKYLEELRGFRMRTKVDDFMEKWTGAHQPDSQELDFELEEEVWRKCNLERLEPLRKRSLEGSVLPLPLKRIRKSCIHAVFSLPKSVDGHSLHLEDRQEFFLAHQVLRVLLNGACILDLRVGCGSATGQPEEEVEPGWGEDQGETDRGEQEGDVTYRETDLSASTATVFQTPKKKHRYQKQLSSMEHERMEKKILHLLTEKSRSLKPAALPGEDSEGMVFNPHLGGLRSRKDVMMIVSVGRNHLPGVRVAERIRDKARAMSAFRTYGKLPHKVASLHISQETAADLKVASSHVQKSITTRDISLKLDVPAMQRPKEYYITAIANFLNQCRQPGATIWYMGHSEEGTGDWCFKDGTISFQEVFDLYMTHLPGRLLTIVSDCCYSGNWVHRCAETLDNKLGIPPCGHKARERGVLIKVCASCQGNQKAAEPCFSTDATYVDANSGTLKSRGNPQLTEHQTTMITDFTQLVCCRDPWSPCPADDAFKNWKWDDAMSGEMRRNIYPVRGNDKGRPAWHYVLLSSGDEDHVQGFKEQYRTGTINVADWGYAIESGWGEDPPDNNRDKVRNWTWVCQ